LVGEGTSWQTTWASALAFIRIQLVDGRTKWGAGVDANVELAAIKEMRR
jgi:2-isopropylmalate synthase